MPECAEWESLRVRDLVQRFSFPANVLSPDRSIDDLLRKFVENPRCRHVYVIDDDQRLVGVVRMNSVVQYLFPYAGMRINTNEWILGDLPRIARVNLKDLINDRPHCVHPETSLTEMAEILISEKINELPVVDQDRRLIGQVNVFEIIVRYLERRNEDRSHKEQHR